MYQVSFAINDRKRGNKPHRNLYIGHIAQIDKVITSEQSGMKIT